MALTAETRNNLALALGSLLLALGAAEIVVRVADPVRPPDRIEYEVDEKTYWRVRPSQTDDRPPATNVNAQGFRGSRNVGPKDVAKTRVLVLGDSFAWGWGVADDQTFAAQLEARAQGRFDVINGGTPGWGIFQFQAQLERWIGELQPDVVVVFVNTGDILRQPYASREEERRFLRDSALRNRIRDFSKLVTTVYRLIERYRLAAQNRVVANAHAMDARGGVNPELYARLLDRDATRLRAMHDLAAANGARFVLVAWPQQVPMTPAFLDSMKQVAATIDATYVDMSPTLAAHPLESYSLPNDVHPSELGHRLVAERLAAALTEQVDQQ
jgi:lysophospholipase L1-like esterase